MLSDHLLQKGYTLDELVLAGLTVRKKSDNGKDRYFDMFRSRAMFPIIDAHGNVLAFGGRTLEKREPKYLNTADTPVFNKRKGVFAANLLRQQRHLERVILVEGYMDVVSLTQFGVEGVCATLGTALTNEQARLLKRYAPQVYLGYDGDSAGQHAILRGLDILEQENVPARVLDFPDGLDPDEFIRRDGIEGFRQLPAISPATYRLRRLKDQFDLSTQDGRLAYARGAAEIVSAVDPLERDVLLGQLCRVQGAALFAFTPRMVFLKGFGVFLLRNLCGDALAKHGENQFEVVHVVTKVLVLFGQAFVFLVFRRCHAESRL